ncbi:MAG: pseudouridine-5'-phosphate glycosidase [Pyrinomonadaceae bacterium]
MNLNYSEEVSDAISDGRPIVALESTVIAHGLPYPQNLETALRLENIVRENGAVPATIALFAGDVFCGCSNEQIERLAAIDGINKISTRDLAIAVANKLDCATTVATTSFIAHKAGIKIFATGGIGGVHRGYSQDVSADLPALARTPITVVCSGAKIVLDLPATREWLETNGVPVLGWRCDELPAFYSRSSALPVDVRIETAADAAKIAASRDEIGLTSAILVVVPVPQKFEISIRDAEEILAASLFDAERARVTGKQITPFLLDQMSQKSSGKTLTTNIALLENNAYIAALIACA